MSVVETAPPAPEQEQISISEQFGGLDKNKSAFKLKGMGPIYYLNLDGQPERREYMEFQFHIGV